MYEEYALHFYYSLADRLNKSVEEIYKLSIGELEGWKIYFEKLKDG